MLVVARYTKMSPPKDTSGRSARAPEPGKPAKHQTRLDTPVDREYRSAQRDGTPVSLSVTLPAAIAEQLRERIIEGEWAPGSRLNERKLCDRLGVSRTPLREAFRLLEADGLVELHPNRGAHVVALSESDIRESFELMGALEALSGELACARITADEITEIKASTFQMLACHARRDLPAYYHLNRVIHDCINRAARNAQLTQTYATLNLRIQNLRFRSNFDDDKWNKAAPSTRRWSWRSRPATARASRPSCANICGTRATRCSTRCGRHARMALSRSLSMLTFANCWHATRFFVAVSQRRRAAAHANCGRRSYLAFALLVAKRGKAVLPRFATN